MNFKTLSAGIISLSLLSTPAFSLVMYGDEVLRDVDNNMEFLRLDLTMGYSYNGILGEFGNGGDFEGWSVASALNMENMGVSAGITHGSGDPLILALAEEMRDWFCPEGTCVNFSSTHTYARGLVSDTHILEDETLYQEAFSMGRRLNVIPNEADFRISGYGGPNVLSEEVFLVRRVASVPEPATMWLFGMGLLGVFGLSKGRK